MSLNLLGKANGYNNFPKDFKFPEMPEKGTVVKFKLLSEPYLEILNEQAVKVYPNSYTFKATGATYDPETRQTIKIAIVKRVNASGELEEAHKIRFSPKLNNNILHLTIGSSVEEDAAYVFLMLNSLRKRGDDELDTKDDSIIPEYELIDEVGEAKSRIAKREQLRKAWDIAKGLKDGDLAGACLTLGFDHKADIAIMRDKIEYYAEKFPYEFIKRMESDDSKYIVLFNQALNERVLTVDGSNIKWVEGGSVAVPMRYAAVGEKAADEFVHFIKTHDIAKNVLDILRVRVSEAENKFKETKRVGRKPAEK